MEICKSCGESVEGNCSKCAVSEWSRQFKNVQEMRDYMDRVDSLERYNRKMENLKVFRLRQHLKTLFIFAMIIMALYFFLDSTNIGLTYEDHKLDILRAHGVK